MKRIRVVSLIIVTVALSATVMAQAQWGDVLNKAKGLAGGGSTTSSGAEPIAYVAVATAEFLRSSQLVADATGNAEWARKMSAAIDKIKQPGGVTKENLGVVDEAEAETTKILADKEKLAKADRQKMTQATVHAGVASFFEAKAVDSAKSAGGKNLANPVSSLLLATVVPSNLKSMVSVDKALLEYASAHGIDKSSITSSVNQRVVELQPK
jgi:hypothetical protein